jgi:hypothetical protein
MHQQQQQQMQMAQAQSQQNNSSVSYPQVGLMAEADFQIQALRRQQSLGQQDNDAHKAYEKQMHQDQAIRLQQQNQNGSQAGTPFAPQTPNMTHSVETLSPAQITTASPRTTMTAGSQQMQRNQSRSTIGVGIGVGVGVGSGSMLPPQSPAAAIRTTTPKPLGVGVGVGVGVGKMTPKMQKEELVSLLKGFKW